MVQILQLKLVRYLFGYVLVLQVLKKLAIFDNWSKIAVHVALDNILVKEDVEIMARLQIPDDAVKIINGTQFL